jgi:hypothetical protein
VFLLWCSAPPSRIRALPGMWHFKRKEAVGEEAETQERERLMTFWCGGRRRPGFVAFLQVRFR